MLGAWEEVGGGGGSELRIVFWACTASTGQWMGAVCVMEFWQCCAMM